jgi:hypothetical protein
MSGEKPEMIENAETAYESLRYLLESTLAPSDFRDALGDLDILVNPMRAMQELDGFEAVAKSHHVRGYTFDVAPLVRCKACARVYEDDNGGESLLALMAVAEAHECPVKTPADQEAKDEVDKAWEAVQKAYKDATGGLGMLFDTKTWPLAVAMQAYVHTIVKVERDKVAEEYRNSGADSTPDWDALDRLVDLTEPGRDGR